MSFLYGCGGSPSDSTSKPVSTCDVGDIEFSMTARLNELPSSTDFTLQMERGDGLVYTFSKGGSDINTVYESASTSKWVSAAIVLWVKDQVTGFDLTDRPSDHYSWTMPPADPLYGTTLSQLLSFTSGLNDDPLCLSVNSSDSRYKLFDDCINDSQGVILSNSIVSANDGEGRAPGLEFSYGSSHLQLAGAMAIGAGSYADWQAVFSAFQTATGLWTNSTYSLAGSDNPRLAGGMTWTAGDYMSFLRALYKRSFLSSLSHDEMFKDQTSGLSLTNESKSPAFDALTEEWHYGFGVWLQCPSATFNCLNIDYYSSPGAFGAYPFINFNKNFFGIVARQGALGTYPEGVSLYRAVQDLAESWADCKE